LAKLLTVGIIGGVNFIADRSLYERVESSQLLLDKSFEMQFFNYQLGYGKRCVALKIWCVMRYFGVKKLQE
jgi:hypothetical protein